MLYNNILVEFIMISILDPLLLKVSPEGRGIFNVVKFAVISNGLELQHASDILKNCNVIASLAVKQNHLAILFVGEELRQNGEFMAQFDMVPSQLLKVDPESRGNFNVVKFSVMHNGLDIQYASDNLKKNRTIAKLSVEQNRLAIYLISETLRKDQSFLKEVGLDPNVEGG